MQSITKWFNVLIQSWNTIFFGFLAFGGFYLLMQGNLLAGALLLGILMLSPFAFMRWTMPSAIEWVSLFLCGILGSLGHYCMTRAFRAADISSIQAISFLNLIWASIGGFLVFASVPGVWTIVGAAVIFASTLLLARHEAGLARAARKAA